LSFIGQIHDNYLYKDYPDEQKSEINIESDLKRIGGEEIEDSDSINEF